ncbi:trypsin-like serine protease [Micromonospora sp. DR5-3]|uniref:trypsin-like serine protease n=1 Tax=unclassified Micromonospora TaxID=2617518 RepID=UPI0011DB9F82|nr:MULTISPECIES: trypsin-like serine protease [unclassified Micromonospora]MCW3816221.1 trypsin-like serine protease [Micromonospora sp. DR5-3]TYC23962.1 trypsin-like serine protease [Micromonospora sp. MP36]
MAQEAETAGTRRRRAAGILAGIALGGAAVVAPGTAVQAAPAGGASDARTVQAERPTKLPHFREGKFTPPAPGAYGPRFQSKGTGATPRIVGGTTVSAADHPYIVGVVTYLDTGIGWCTGTVVAPNKVLTAAHCTADGAGTTRVIAGHDQLLDANGNIITTAGYVAEVGSTWTHQGWNIAAQYDQTADTILDDVSVLTLKKDLPVEYTPITFSAQGETAYAPGDMADIVGYGVTSSDENVDPGDTRLRRASVPIQTDTYCAADANQARIGYDANRMLCAGNGTPTTPSADTCGGDSGGPLLVNGKQVGLTDWGYGNCGEHPGFYEELGYYSDSIKADFTRPPLVNADWTGDGHTDLIARDSAGKLRLFVGSGFGNDGYGGFWSNDRILGTGWGSFKRVFRVYNWNGDNKPSIMVVNTANELWIYNTDGAGNFAGAPKLIGTGWGSFTALMVTNNWLGNNRPSLMVRRDNGDLVRYTSNGAGGWDNPKGTLIGTGYNSFNLFLTPGAWKGDGLEVLICRTTTGDLKLYQSDGQGGWTNPKGTVIGTGWGGFKNILTPGDWNGDNMVDMLGVNSVDDMRMYTTDGYGNWIDARGKTIMGGWGAYNLVF